LPLPIAWIFLILFLLLSFAESPYLPLTTPLIREPGEKYSKKIEKRKRFINPGSAQESFDKVYGTSG
jgi:hypothetical protein